jgi:hypothetical protein
MKTLSLFSLLTIVIIGNLSAVDLESYEFIETLLTLPEAREPFVFEDAVIFTVSGSYRKAGIAFLHEGFSRIHPFKKLIVPIIDETVEFDAQKQPELLRDSGIMFFAYTVPPSVTSLEYRLVLDGLWSTDPYNPRRSFNAGIGYSVAPLPSRGFTETAEKESFPGIVFSLRGNASGEHITVAGDFNGWDPFMYELKETRRGLYTLAVPLPPGTWRYIYYRNGERFIDYSNTNREYTEDGSAVNIAVVK